jgi:hypothetical protein
MPSYIEINDGLNLVYQTIKSTAPVIQQRKKVNHIWIYDRSGSMYSVLGELTEQLIKLSKGLPKGDTLSLGWFSGEGDFNFVFKGFKITEDSDYVALEKSIHANNTTRGLTCFSEILADTSKVIEDLSVFSDVFSMHFFTDGYPVVSNHRKEIENIFTAIKNLNGKIHTAMFVGYGHYYNKELMSEMAEKLGAMLIHSSLVPEYSNSITKLLELTDSQEPRQEVESLVQNPLAAYMVTDQGVVLYSAVNGKLSVAPPREKSATLFYLSTEKPNKKSWKRVEIDKVSFADSSDTIAKGLYAAALVLTQQTKTDLALSVIGKIGDKKVVDLLNNAFTIDEYGVAEAFINTSISDAKTRFENGRDQHYLPKDDAFCAFDLLDMLVNDSESAFYPCGKEFQYERTSPSPHTDSKYPRFVASSDTACAFNTLVWHASRLNLNVQTNIPGEVTAVKVNGKSASDFDLPEVISAHIFRNYTFIKDGLIHVKRFFVKSSKEVYLRCKNEGLVFEDGYDASGIYGLDISKLPSINRMIANGRTSATELSRNVFKEQSLKAQIKVLKWLKSSTLGDVDFTETSYTDEQLEFLTEQGINGKKGNIYDPPTVSVESTDKYLAKSFEIKIDKMNSLPTVAKVMEKIAAGKSLTPVELLLEEGIHIYEVFKKQLNSSSNNDQDISIWFETTIKLKQQKMLEIRRNIQQTKFAVILGKKWFDEFKSRDDTEIEVDGRKFTFVLKEVEVKY